MPNNMKSSLEELSPRLSVATTGELDTRGQVSTVMINVIIIIIRVRLGGCIPILR